MIQIIIALLMTLGIIASPDEYYNMTPEQQQAAHEIVIEDTVGM
ncbi:MAG: hypothetical protein AAFP19_09110 [Bacteroidota bacterium]